MGGNMRVISGKYKGRQLDGFTLDGTRPTMDRVKESMFAMIQNKLKDSIILDLFAGSGALGIEALSNGAKMCYFVDKSKQAMETIQKNTKDMEDVILLKQDCMEALSYFKNNNITFDIILLDPPYHEKLLQKVIEKIQTYDLLNPEGIIICEREEEEIHTEYTLIKNKQYGTKNVEIYCKK